MQYIHPKARFSKNANFLVSDGSDRFVFRILSNGAPAVATESGILARLKGTAVRAPDLLGTLEIPGAAVLVMEYVDGITLEDRLLEGEVAHSFFEELGAQLAQVHSISHEKSGFLGAGFQPDGAYENSSTFVKEYLDKSWAALEKREDRIDLETNKRVQNLLAEKWKIVQATEPARQLVHCDFNPKNILVSRGTATKVLALLDWEFAWIGNGIMDFGNFFRFAYDYPPGAKESFLQGYQSVKSLPSHWEDAALITDLGNMCFFLERKEDYAESFRTAREVVRCTLEQFGY